MKNNIFDDIDSLPTLPMIVTQIYSQMNNPRSSLKEVANIILKDQAISTKILKLVNSAFYGFPKRIGTITHAISILGFETVRGLILGVSMIDTFRIKEFDLVNFWEHSVRTAVLSSMIAKKIRYPRADEAFTIGLIHDIGKLVIMLKMPEAYKNVLLELDNMAEPYRAILGVESDTLGFDHTYAGAQMARLWNFPISYIESISRHHRGEHLDSNSLEYIVFLSNLIANYQEYNQNTENLAGHSYYIRSMLNKINLDSDDILEELAATEAEINEFFHIIYP